MQGSKTLLVVQTMACVMCAGAAVMDSFAKQYAFAFLMLSLAAFNAWRMSLNIKALRGHRGQ